MSVAQAQTVPRWRRIGLWSVKAVLALVFIAAGSMKLYGTPAMVQTFEQIGFGQWFRYLTGVLELVGAVAILIPAIAGFGGLLLSSIMVGATLTHLLGVPGSLPFAIALFALSALVASAHRREVEVFVRSIFVSTSKGV